MKALHLFLFAMMLAILTPPVALAKGGDKVDVRLRYEANHYYVMKGDVTCALSSREGKHERVADREVAFKGADLLVKSPEDCLLMSMSPERAAIYAILRMASQRYEAGKKLGMSFEWKNLITLSMQVEFSGFQNELGTRFATFQGSGMLSRHPALASQMTYEFTAWYNPERERFERIDLSMRGKVKEVPLWYGEYPGFQSQYYDLDAKGSLQLIHLNETGGMPMCYTDDAVELGVQLLWEQQGKEGAWSKGLSTTALSMMSLLKSGVSPDDPRLYKGLQFLLDKYKVFDVYDIYQPNVYTQGVILAYAYSNRDWIRKSLKKEEQEKVIEMVKWQATQLANDFSVGDDGWGDMSRTQYAMMGLFCATATGWWRPEPELAKDITDMLLQMQSGTGVKVKLVHRTREEREDEDGRIAKGDSESDAPTSYATDRNTYWNDDTEEAFARSWTYKFFTAKAGNGGGKGAGAAQAERQTTPRGSMVCGAIGSVCFASELMLLTGQLTPEYKRKIAISLRDGRAWMQHHFAVDQNPNFTRKYTFQLYYLYALERACAMADWEFIGEHDWYEEGALELMRRQIKDGLWKERDTEHCPDVAATCFAILFFKRGSLAFKNSTVTSD